MKTTSVLSPRLALSPVRRQGRLATKATIGGCVWLAAMLIVHPSPFDPAWADAILMLAPLVLVPLGLRLIERVGESGPSSLWRGALRAQFPAAVLLQLSFLLEQGPLAAALALPWFGVTLLLAFCGLRRLAERGLRFRADICLDFSFVFIAVGGGWTLLSRFGARPLGFQPIIVLLTGIHFHYAGFLLPLLTGLAARQSGGRAGRAIGALVIASVPLVAVGITGTQLGAPWWIEMTAALSMSLGGLLLAGLQGRLATEPGFSPLARGLFGLSATALGAAMLFSTLYGLRFVGVTPWLDIPWMRVLHGTTNAIGFALPGVLAWTVVMSEIRPGHPDGNSSGESIKPPTHQ
jgi:hypothetical protein